MKTENLINTVENATTLKLASEVLRVINNPELCPANMICIIEKMMERKIRELE